MNGKKRHPLHHHHADQLSTTVHYRGRDPVNAAIPFTGHLYMGHLPAFKRMLEQTVVKIQRCVLPQQRHRLWIDAAVGCRVQAAALQLTIIRQQVQQLIARGQHFRVTLVHHHVTQTEQGIAYRVRTDQQVLFQPVVGQPQQDVALGQILKPVQRVAGAAFRAVQPHPPHIGELTGDQHDDIPPKEGEFRKGKARIQAYGFTGEPGEQQRKHAQGAQQGAVSQRHQHHHYDAPTDTALEYQRIVRPHQEPHQYRQHHQKRRFQPGHGPQLRGREKPRQAIVAEVAEHQSITGAIRSSITRCPVSPSD